MGVSETIRGACPLCESGCPPECKSLKPHGYADAPQWQKDAWDSETNKLMQAAADALKEPSSGGWVMPSEVLYGHLDIPAPLEFPAINTIRGGILYPRYVVEARVGRARKRFLRRQTWNVDVSYYDVSQKRFMNHIMEGFPAENLAVNAAEIIKFMIMNINEQYHEEKRRARA